MEYTVLLCVLLACSLGLNYVCMSLIIIPVHTDKADVEIITKDVSLLWREEGTPIRVNFKLKRDRFDNEGEETFTLRLFSTDAPSGYNYFFIQDVTITIKDRPGTSDRDLNVTVTT